MCSRKFLSLCIAWFWLCAAVPRTAFAEYPEHPVTVYHPFEPTPYDALSKVYNAEMSKILGVPFVFEYGMMGKAAQSQNRAMQSDRIFLEDIALPRRDPFERSQKQAFAMSGDITICGARAGSQNPD